MLDRDNLMTVIINLLQNAYACYMKLGHYKEATRCALYIKGLMPDYLKSYLLIAQIPYFNSAATIREVRAAL
jgi:hypothetical protein